jgi:hypothetical protein
MLVRARFSGQGAARGPWLTLIVDTGATKCVLFEEAFPSTIDTRRWPSLAGLKAPTLLGLSAARVVRIPILRLEAPSGELAASGVDAAFIRSELSGVLSRVAGETVHGLLGYSFLKRHRVLIDYPNRVLWLTPVLGEWDDRPFEYSHVGIQLEQADHRVRIMTVAEGSPAAQAGIAPGDTLLAVDGTPVEALPLSDIVRQLEGKPGTRVRLTTRRADAERTYLLVRRRLL